VFASSPSELGHAASGVHSLVTMPVYIQCIKTSKCGDSIRESDEALLYVGIKTKRTVMAEIRNRKPK
jgi:hypothetical protein